MAEVTVDGYSLKTQNEWFAEEQQRYLDIDPLWNLDPSTPDGIKTATDAEIWSNLDELGLAAYNSKDPDKAAGYDLDVLASITGTVRSPGTPSNAVVTITGVAATAIPAGQLIESTENGSQWTTDSAEVIDPGGTVLANVSCTVFGATQASAGALTKILTPIGGWQSVTNASPAVAGTNQDSDAELRAERNNSVSLPGSNQIDSTFSAIAATDGVRHVKIYENDTGSVDGDGLPAHSTAIVVDGGTDEDVALSIYFKRNPGPIQHNAATLVSENVTSPVTGNEKTIIFARPTYIPMVIYVEVTDDGSLPANAGDLIKASILEYVTSDINLTSGAFNVSGFDIGEDVVISRLYTPINAVIGSYGNSFVDVLNLNGGLINIAIAFNELSQFAEVDITVVIT